MASIILLKECMVRSAESLPFPTMYSPLGSTSQPWGDLGVDIVIESTGIFTDAEKAAANAKAIQPSVVEAFGLESD